METLVEYLSRLGKATLKEPLRFRTVFYRDVKSPKRIHIAKAPGEIYERPLPLRYRRGRIQALRQGPVCEDCLARAEEQRVNTEKPQVTPLDIMGNPRRHPWFGFNLAGKCEGCGGTGNGTGVWVDINEALKKLTLKQRFVIERRYGISGDGHEYTQQELADSLGITQQMVAKHEDAAKRRIRIFLEGLRTL